MSAKALTLTKEERISSRTLIEKLFDGGNSRSMTAYPVRLVYLPMSRQPQEAAVKILISAPKRNLKHAVDRNRVKRQIREAYRQNKYVLIDKLGDTTGAALAFIWLEKQLYESKEVEQRIVNLLKRVGEKL